MSLPERIGRYKIKAELGRGGMAVVYHAYDPRFEREVAIKVLSREVLHNPQFRSRFEREIKLVAGLEHPSIVPVYDVGDEDGQPYLVMRYMTGGSLSRRIAAGRLSLQEAARIIEKVAQGLAFAHQRGIIHRDVKPDNILFDANHEPFISDFGVAKVSEASAASVGVVGTPAYMSPEQARGGDLDLRSDIYSLGVIVYQMLTGELPFQSDVPMRVYFQHMTESVPDILKLRSDLPEAMRDFINTALSKEIPKRHQSAGELARALNVIAFGTEGSAAFDEPRTESIGRLGSIFAGILVLVALVGFVLMRGQLSFAERPTPTAPPSAVPTLVTVTFAPPTATATLTATISPYAPYCSETVILPTPFVRETNYTCFKRRPYTALTIPEDATFEVFDPKGEGTCISEATSNGRRVLSCSGPNFQVYDLKVCVPPVIPESDLGKCSLGDTFDSTNQCCVAAPAQGAGCTIFVIKLKGC